ncbi:MAG: aldehyde dehydrogenase family protein [Panacagrimonas sp.]
MDGDRGLTALLPQVKEFIGQPRKVLIDGKLVPAKSGKTFEVYNPATGQVIGHAAACEKADVDVAVAAARKAFDTGPWTKMTPSERSRIIWKIGDLILKYTEELAQLESIDNGKPIAIARAADVVLAADIFHYMAGWATKIEGSVLNLSVPYTPGVEYQAFTRKEPIGVVAQIIPWNFPLLMAAWKLAPVLAAGCTVVMKLAEETPMSGLRLAEIMTEAGLPDGVVNILTGFGETCGAPLAAHPNVDKVAFTGSTEVGKLIVKAASNDLKKVTLELGGKSPNIICDDADLELAIAGAAMGIFFNHGQACCAGSRLFVQEKIFDKVVAGIADIGKKIKLGPGLDPTTEMGPMVSQTQYERVSGFLTSGREQGATALCGGKPVTGNGYFIEPTVLVNTNDSMKVVQEEIFGPVLTAMPFKNIDEDLIRRANDSLYGLAAGIFTTNINKAHKIANRLKAGTVWVNCYNIFDASMPFGGYKQSGWGREMGHEVLKNYLETKSVCVSLGGAI